MGVLNMNDEGFKRLCQHDLGCFIYFAFKELYPHEEYHHNWHIDLIQDYLTRVSRGEINRLIISMPPRMLKSFCVSVAWPAWLMGRDPSKKILLSNNWNFNQQRPRNPGNSASSRLK